MLRWRLAILSLAAVPCLAALALRDPAEPGWFPPCPFYLLTGRHCPGCGTLRALHQLLNGHLLMAFGLNPLAMLALPFIGYAFLSSLALAVRGQRLPTVFIPAGGIWTLLAVIILFWILRNIPVYPFSWLAP